MTSSLRRYWLILCLSPIIAFVATSFILEQLHVNRIVNQRSRQKRAIKEIQAIADAMQSYISFKNSLPTISVANSHSHWQFVPFRKVKGNLEAFSKSTLPTRDPWGSEYLYAIPLSNDHFSIVSLGKNHRLESRDIPILLNHTSCFESDIIWLDRSFIQCPDGKQEFCEEK